MSRSHAGRSRRAADPDYRYHSDVVGIEPRFRQPVSAVAASNRFGITDDVEIARCYNPNR
jgi:hypothetical protein